VALAEAEWPGECEMAAGIGAESRREMDLWHPEAAASWQTRFWDIGLAVREADIAHVMLHSSLWRLDTGRLAFEAQLAEVERARQQTQSAVFSALWPSPKQPSVGAALLWMDWLRLWTRT
jgi:hypothetical protein